MKTKYINPIFICIILCTIITSYSQNILTDGDFSLTTNIVSFVDGLPPANVWSTWQGDNIEANATVINSECNYQILSSGNQRYEVQLVQAGFSLVPEHSYQLSFDIKANSNRTFGVFLGENGGNWINFLGANNYKQNATTEWRKISIEFDVFTVFPYHKLSFELGTRNISIFLDNVILIDLGVKKQAVSSKLNTFNKNISNPGFRPKSDFDQAFINSYKESAFIIYPTITRSIDTITWSTLLSKKFAENLKRDVNLNILLNENLFNPGKLMGESQFEFFNNDMVRLGNEIKMKKEKTDYCIIPEILFEPEREGTLFVFGIHIFILNNEGENVFSFLLNSHHELFVEAKLYAYNPNENDLEKLKRRCLDVGGKAFKLMVN
ncbi:Carbohydrate binding domain-containing protein [Lutibacter agarilyticus]|uniref:Carbohydrate binding domain-containing protein n=1 Tax=Lutibacter agarilyticus TaxID=1109740 RepID=A0A238X434_9FLAO|nr:carbohydrate binding domain-containing protein [Lutibacter agarilyticus]SNR53460.1 Carbohydrate binding domain-containing protein [Lutibacter agarilyticus]